MNLDGLVISVQSASDRLMDLQRTIDTIHQMAKDLAMPTTRTVRDTFRYRGGTLNVDLTITQP